MGFLADMQAQARAKPPKGAFTTRDVVATGRCQSAQASRILRDKAASGELACDKFFVDGHWTYYYWEPKQ